ncbi:hypothetical protein TIFTF001_047093 [Ficus carica]|uniref:Uncharacterized protein n=1 Tax=Ficus carica TaxID=3494 RepID=A0AA87YYP3_FICCA|nr:hypothetical protein TIFTF001_047093 [Ficus carica]
MAKGRKLTTSRSERLLGSYGSYGHSQGSSTATESSEELGEVDVWSTVEDAAERGDHAAAVAGGGVRRRERSPDQEPRPEPAGRQPRGRAVAGVRLGEDDVVDEDRPPVLGKRRRLVASAPHGNVGAGERPRLEQDPAGRVGRLASRAGRRFRRLWLRLGDRPAARIPGA